MAEHTATILWEHAGEPFSTGKYSREHTWSFDGGVTVPASPAPAVVPPPMSNDKAVDPEEAFVASVSSCHMLTFLYVASRKGFAIQSYRDNAIGKTAKNDEGFFWVSEITLEPQIVYSGDKTPTDDEAKELHHLAHQQCFIANSIKTQVTIV